MSLSLVIPTHDNPSLLRILLKNMKMTQNWSDEVVVVSDGSDRQHIEEKVALSFGARFVAMPERSGFAKTANAGVRATTGDLVMMVNSDITFMHPCVGAIEKHFLDEEDMGVMGFKLFLPNGKIQHAGGYMMWTEGRHLGYHMNDYELKEMNRTYYPTYVTGALFAFRRSLYDKIGGFNEEYIFGYEDAEFCAKSWLHGFAVRYEPTIEAIHGEGLSRKDDPLDAEWVKIQWEKSRTIFHNFCLMTEARLEWNTIFYRQWLKNKTVSTPEEHEHLLLIRTGMAGDVITGTTKVVRALKRKNPDLKIYVRSDKWDVFLNNPDVENMGPVMLSPFGRVVQFNMANGIYPKERMDVCHALVAKAAGLDIDIDDEFMNEPPKMCPTEWDWEEIQKRLMLRPGEKYAVVHQPGTNWKNKTLPKLVWAEVQHFLKTLGLKVIIVGKKRDEGPAWPGVVDAREKDNLMMLNQLIAHAQVFVGVDSGPFHVCQCTDTPGVVVFTCYPPELLIVSKNILPVIPTGCHGCYVRQPAPVMWCDCPEGKGYECSKTVTAESIIGRIKEALA
jgi:ADP-heptose:LPS heptosyltransferase